MLNIVVKGVQIVVGLAAGFAIADATEKVVDKTFKKVKALKKEA